ncbi:MAG: ABC transporter substrate-binding protein [SAR324 cluster bacterium]|nr:ABC transporter substrate-binding protein [SAR324 cluster bacterium]
MRAVKLLAVFFIVTGLFYPIRANDIEPRYRIALFITRGPGDPFWGMFVDFMRAATNDLNMDLDVYYADSNREKMRQQILQASEEVEKVNALIFPNFKKGALSFLRIAEEKKIPAFLVNSGVTDEEFIGNPREQFKFWIGELLPDEESAGYLLANLLIDEAIRLGKFDPQGKVQILGFMGIISDFASSERTKGLYRAINSRQDAFLRQVVPANWQKDYAQSSFQILKHRYPWASVAWSASDLMAIGVIDAVEKQQLHPGVDVITGGVDWTAEGLLAVKTKKMTVSVGGHFMEGAWAAVLLYDYLHGKDFADLQLRWRLKMLAATQNNIDIYLEKLAKDNWEKIDFTQFSRHLHPEKNYNFSLKRVLSMVN